MQLNFDTVSHADKHNEATNVFNSPILSQSLQNDKGKMNS